MNRIELLASVSSAGKSRGWDLPAMQQQVKDYSAHPQDFLVHSLPLLVGVRDDDQPGSVLRALGSVSRRAPRARRKIRDRLALQLTFDDENIEPSPPASPDASFHVPASSRRNLKSKALLSDSDSDTPADASPAASPAFNPNTTIERLQSKFPFLSLDSPSSSSSTSSSSPPSPTADVSYRSDGMDSFIVGDDEIEYEDSAAEDDDDDTASPSPYLDLSAQSPTSCDCDSSFTPSSPEDAELSFPGFGGALEDADEARSPAPASIAATPVSVTPSSSSLAAFKRQREQLTSQLFLQYNRDIFDDALPHSLPITWNSRMRKTAGWTYLERKGGKYTARIELGSKVVDRPARLRQTLVHEMCHAAAWLVDHVSKPPHGRVFKRWARQALQRAGIRVTTTHTYAIEFKFRYVCQGCSKIFGRHSDSIDTATKVCGACRGRLVRISNTGKPKKKRAPTAFALFVKKHMSRIVRENPDVPHRERMQLLSAEYHASKASS